MRCCFPPTANEHAPRRGNHARILHKEADPERACRQLVARANAEGRKDNITVILARYEAGVTGNSALDMAETELFDMVRSLLTRVYDRRGERQFFSNGRGSVLSAFSSSVFGAPLADTHLITRKPRRWSYRPMVEMLEQRTVPVGQEVDPPA